MTRDEIKKKALEAAEAAKEFNRKPPYWAVVVLGIVIIIAVQAIRFSIIR